MANGAENEKDFGYCTVLDNKAGHPPTDEDLYGPGGRIYGKHYREQILNCHFEENRASGVGSGLALNSADVSLHKNTFKNNYAMLGGCHHYCGQAQFFARAFSDMSIFTMPRSEISQGHIAPLLCGQEVGHPAGKQPAHREYL